MGNVIHSRLRIVSIVFMTLIVLGAAASVLKTPNYTGLYINQNEGITHVETEYIDQKIYLNVFIEKPMSCSKIINLLGINNIQIQNKKYLPKCISSTNDSVKITYEE